MDKKQAPAEASAHFNNSGLKFSTPFSYFLNFPLQT